MKVEVLTLPGCPNAEAAVRLVAEAGAAGRGEVVVKRVDVPDADAAVRMRFLGSPSIRVDGHDVEPGADARDDFAWACRVYRTSTGMSGIPERGWVAAALAAADARR